MEIDNTWLTKEIPSSLTILPMTLCIRIITFLRKLNISLFFRFVKILKTLKKTTAAASAAAVKFLAAKACKHFFHRP